jgi:Histidine kinase
VAGHALSPGFSAVVGGAYNRRMTNASAAANRRAATWWAPALAGIRGVSWQTVALIVAINTGYAAIMSIEDSRPFWHPLITAQCFGLAIAYFVNAASPWEKTHPVWRLVLAVALGTVAGYALVVLVKGHLLALEGYTFKELVSNSHSFGWTLVSGFGNGMFVGLVFLFKFREARTRAAMLQADADRNLLSKQAIEAELKLMQAQVEPHFLFNTLASVQFLTETEPIKANRMLGHLLDYLRAALPQLRSDSTTLGRRICRSCRCAWVRDSHW